MEKLFENKTVISADIDEVKNILASSNISQWAYDISGSTECGDDLLELKRPKKTFNGREILNITDGGNEVFYDIKGDKLDYKIKFELTSIGNSTLINEIFYVESRKSFMIILKIMKPIIKKEFMKNLNTLAYILDT
ncbi:hypothetical protein BG261_02270 [Floricoccus tropicus]|uniref:Polyketide cyclase n=1 Tax=Floricoccus tropicus TaxID=1859473 RepID=A0A1E8GME1_9LACT|nr:hypothetical protein [Floricoccus tropicus]OFI49424.1 hypothetical protein BG261_02270 [Floricoccus tropicus]